MFSRRGVRADLGAGLAKGEGGMIMRAESGLELFSAAALLLVAALCCVTLESDELFREMDGCDVGGLIEDFGPESSVALSNDRSKLLSLKLNRVLVAEAGL